MIYLIHLYEPLSHARHYLGYTAGDPETRLREHRTDKGAKMLRECNRIGIDYEIVATWPGDRKDERRMKNWKKIKGKCPICSPSLSKKCKT